jgi:hypothetical protein
MFPDRWPETFTMQRQEIESDMNIFFLIEGRPFPSLFGHTTPGPEDSVMVVLKWEALKISKDRYVFIF